MIRLHLAAEGDTADRESDVSEAAVRWGDCIRVKEQGVGVGAIVADRRPVVAVVACAVQGVAWADVTAPDKHQRRPYNSIRIS